MRILTYLGIKEICEESIKAFSTAIASGALPQLKGLQLGLGGENGIGDTGCTALAEACSMGALGKLLSLDLAFNDISDSGAIVLAEAFARGSMWALDTLNLSGNQIGDTGLQAFAGAIGSGSMENTRTLNLSWNKIGHAGTIAFADAIKRTAENPIGSLRALESLDLSSNQIGDVGMIEFFRSIPIDPMVALQGALIGDVSMQALKDAIGSGSLRSLTELSLHDNQIGDAGMIELYSSIARGSLPSLQMLSVDEGPLGNEYPQLKAVCEARGIYLPWGLRR
jgi:hypothetical protein